MGGTLLLLIASIMKWVLTPVLGCYGIMMSLLKGEFNEWQRNLAIAKDCYGNVLGKYLFNQILIKSEGIQFGNRKEAISSVLGKNERDNTLLPLGKIKIIAFLNLFEKDHCKKSIDDKV